LIIKWGQKSKPPKSLGLPIKAKVIPGPKIPVTPGKSHAKFPCL